MATKKAKKKAEVEEQEQQSNEQAVSEKETKEPTVEGLQETIEELKDKNLRIFAEFENYKKRTNKERMDFFKTANQEMMTALLPIIDDFERAQKSMEDTQDVKAIKEGVDLIYNKLKSILEQKGLKEIEPATGNDFDLDYHEAITKIPAPSDELKGKVVDQVEKGYLLGDKVIRYSKVVIGE